MLRQLRKKKTMKRILWTLVILIIPPFTFWGVGSVMRSKEKGPAYAGIIFGRKISFEEYSASWQAVKNQVLLMYGSRSNEVYDTLDLDRQAWDRLILLTEAKRRKIRASDQEVIETIQGFPFLQSKGQFDKRAYELVLAQFFRTSAREFEEELRDFLIIAKLRNSIIGGTKINSEELMEAYKKENEKYRIAYILISPDRFKNKVKVDEKVLRGYYEANAASFRIPEQVNCEYMSFEFSDEAGTKEKALLDAEKIDYILADKTRGFEEVAKENSIQIKETGLFAREGPIPQIGFFSEIQKIAFKLKIGERSELIRPSTDFARGYYIIKLKERKAPFIPPFEEVREKIESIARDEGANILASKEAARLHKRMLELIKTRGVNFDGAAAKIRRRPRLTEPFTRDGYIPGLGLASEIGDTAFNAKVGAVSPAIKTRAGVCIFTVVEVVPISEKKFKKERKAFTKKALEAKRMQILNDWYSNLLRQANLKSNIPTSTSIDALSLS